MPTDCLKIQFTILFWSLCTFASASLLGPCANDCEYTSGWTSWDCSTCSGNAGTLSRYRALCCYLATKSACLTHCNITDSDITQTESCANICAVNNPKTLQTAQTPTTLQLYGSVNRSLVTVKVSTMPSPRTVSTMPSARNVSKMSSARNVSTMPSARNVSTMSSVRIVSTMSSARIVSTMSSARIVSTMPSARNVSTMPSSLNVSTMPSARNVSTMPSARNVSTMQVSQTTSSRKVSTTTANLGASTPSRLVASPTPWIASTNTTKANTSYTGSGDNVTEKTVNINRESNCREVCQHFNGTNRCTKECVETKHDGLCTIVSIGLFLLGMLIGAMVTAITVHCCCCCNRSKHGNKDKPVTRMPRIIETLDKTSSPYNLHMEYPTKNSKRGYGFSPVGIKKFRQISPTSSNASLIYPYSDTDQDSPRVSPKIRSSILDHPVAVSPRNDKSPVISIGTPGVNRINNHARVSLID